MDVVAEVVANTGQSFAQAWRTTWPEYKALSRYWAQWPPAVVSLAVLAKLAPQLRSDYVPPPPGEGEVDANLQAENISALQLLIGSPPPQ